MIAGFSKNLETSDSSIAHVQQKDVGSEFSEAQSGLRTISLRSNFVWAFIGSAVSAFSMWVLLVILTKVGTVAVVGIYAVAQAVGRPITMLLSIKLHIVLVTDAKNEYDFGHYFALRFLTSILVVLISSIIGFTCYSVEIFVVILLLSTGYAVMAVREVLLAVMQKSERMDKIAISNISQGVLAAVFFAAVYIVTKSLALSLSALIVARLLVILCYDVPQASVLLRSGVKAPSPVPIKPKWKKERMLSLTKLAAPLGVVAWLTSLFVSVPRLALDKFYGKEEVGYFAAISSLLVILTMMVSALGQSVSPRLAKYYSEENIPAFKRLLGQVLTFGVFIGAAGILASFLFGKIILSLMFTPAYAEFNNIFIRLTVAAAILVLFTFMNLGLQATRNFKITMLIYAIAAGTGIFCSMVLIPSYGMVGGVWAMLCCYCVGLLGCSIAVLKMIRRKLNTIKFKGVTHGK